jgi:NAD(P)-dependent dehydrogenase (short-subunit alcohol dehydrogenase family)
VNNAGIFPRQQSATVALDAWKRVISVNLIGSFICARVFGAAMLKRRRGAIVNIGSGRAFHGAADGVAYSASKAGLVGLTRSLALEWAPYNVRVNCIVPGLSDTAQPRAVLTDDQLRQAGERIPLGRVGQPADVAGAVSFLLSDDASYITGQSLGVNGGAVLL